MSKIILDHSNLLKLCATAKDQEKKVVFTNGCFDILHPGHTRYLADAKALGDYLVVGINSDKSVQAIKGMKRPIQSESARVEVIAALESVDWVTLFDEETPYELIKLLTPNVLVKGGDWPVEKIIGADLVGQAGGIVSTVPITYEGSTSKIIQTIQES